MSERYKYDFRQLFKLTPLKQRLQARNVAARLEGQRLKPYHIVFEKLEVQIYRRDLDTGHTVEQVAVVGVWLDMEQLEVLARRAASNKNRRSKDGALNVEVHYIKTRESQ